MVAACSYEAREFGIHSAMPSSRAAQLCKDAIFVPPRFDAYREASKKIKAVFRQYTKLIEPLSLDEAYLDVTDISRFCGSATEVAQQIKKQIHEEVNLTASAGVSYNKFLAKVASDMDKPDGIYVIRPEVAESFIEQLEIRKFFGIGKVTEKKMQALGIYTGADLKRLSKIQLQTQFGRSGAYYYDIARGIDDRPVNPTRVRKSIGSETTFDGNIVDKKLIWATLTKLAGGLGSSLQGKGVTARTVTIKVKYSDFQLITRSKTGEQAVHNEASIIDVLPELLRKTEVGKRPIRLIGISLANLNESSDQADNVAKPTKGKEQQLGLF